MGSNFSSISSSASSNIVNNVLTKTFNSVSQRYNVQNTSNMSVVIGKNTTILGCNTNIQQSSDINIVALATMTADVTTTMASDISNEIVSQMKAQVDQLAKGINLGQLNTSITNQSFKLALSNTIQNEIKNQQDQSFSKSDTRTKTIEFNPKIYDCRTGGSINIGQSEIVRVYTDAVFKGVMNNLVSNTATSQVLSQFDAAVKQTASGFSLELFAGIGGAIFVLLAIVGIFAATKKRSANTSQDD